MAFLVITTIGDPNKLERALYAIASTGVSGSTVLSGRVYQEKDAHPYAHDDFGVGTMLDAIIRYDARDGRAILTIVSDSAQIDSIKSAIEKAFTDNKGDTYGFSIVVLPVERVVGLPIHDEKDRGEAR